MYGVQIKPRETSVIFENGALWGKEAGEERMVREGLEQVGREPLLGFDKAVPDAGPRVQRATFKFDEGMDIDGG